MSDVHDGHTPGDGYGPDVDPDTGDEAETEEVDEARRALEWDDDELFRRLERGRPADVTRRGGR